MLLLNIYLVATGISWASYGLFAATSEKKFKRQGYKTNFEKKSKLEHIVETLKGAIILGLPIINIAMPIVLLFKSDELYDKIIEDWLEEGKIYLPDEVEEEKIEINESNDQKNISDDIQISIDPKKENQDIEKVNDDYLVSVQIKKLKKFKEEELNKSSDEDQLDKGYPFIKR